ncbi:MAG TPA: hypothetical protein VKL21_08810 [Candidatus Methanoperedens sp.]|nr:hypothetical protein [Candidatus Methanoperedens sp.]
MLYIGAGGWAYFKVPGLDSLAAYSKAYDRIVGLRGERKPPASAVGIAHPLVSKCLSPKKELSILHFLGIDRHK